MKLQLALGLGLGAHRKVGGEPYITPVLPKADSIVRAWSLRRLIPAYKTGISIRADRPTDPVGAPGIELTFNNQGLLEFPAGANANAYELYDQKGALTSKFIQETLAAAPRVFESNTLLKGLKSLSTSDIRFLAMTGGSSYSDATLDTTMGSGELSISLWTTATSSPYAHHMLFNYQHASAGKWAISWYNGKPHAFCGNTTGTLISANQYHNTGWVHVVITIKGTTNGAKLYVNTNLEDTKNVPSKTTGTTVAPSILALEDGTLGANNDINDIVIWNRELTASEISQVFNATAPYYEES